MPETHHTLLHVESTQSVSSTPIAVTPQDEVISSNTAIGLKSNSLLMICLVSVGAPDGTPVKAQALLDNASSMSFISERLAQSLCLPRSTQNTRISSTAGLSHNLHFNLLLPSTHPHWNNLLSRSMLLLLWYHKLLVICLSIYTFQDRMESPVWSSVRRSWI